MKAVNFIFPNCWNQSVPFFLKNFLYFLPKPHLLSLEKNYFFEFSEILFSIKKNRPIICEICSGNGDWVIEQAKKNPEYFWLAVERRFDRVKKILSKKINSSIENLLIIYGDAFSFFHKFVVADSFCKLFINFPDPWPKKKHIKNRIINTSFVDEVFRTLTYQGSLTLITDDLEFLNYSITFLKKELKPLFFNPHYIVQEEAFGKSWFETLWRNKGKQIFYSEFIKTANETFLCNLGYS